MFLRLVYLRLKCKIRFEINKFRNYETFDSVPSIFMFLRLVYLRLRCKIRFKINKCRNYETFDSVSSIFAFPQLALLFVDRVGSNVIQKEAPADARWSRQRGRIVESPPRRKRFVKSYTNRPAYAYFLGGKYTCIRTYVVAVGRSRVNSQVLSL